MRSIGRLFRAEAAAGGDQATAETDPDPRERSPISADGDWWWDGHRWLPTSTPDGLWHWDGERWRPTIELRSVRPNDLATTLALLAEDRYARAADILVDRAREWRPRGELRELINRAAAMRQSRRSADGAFGVPPLELSGVFRRPRDRTDERQRREEEQLVLDTRYRALLVHVGRSAPRPTVKEADDLLDVARLLDRRAAGITQARVAADNAERAAVRSNEAARRGLLAAEAHRRAAVEAAARAVDAAVRRYEEERQNLGRRVREVLTVAGDEPLAEVGPLRAHAGVIETPAGRLPANGTQASVGSAVALWRRHRDVLLDLVLLGGPEADAFLRCLTERRRDLFLLLSARSATVLWHCPPGEEKPLRRFATAVNQQVGRAPSAEEVSASLAGWTNEAADMVTAAREALARVEADERAAIEAARRRLSETRAEPAELVAARQRVAAEVQAVCTPPPPLGAPRDAAR